VAEALRALASVAPDVEARFDRIRQILEKLLEDPGSLSPETLQAATGEVVKAEPLALLRLAREKPDVFLAMLEKVRPAK
jgi:hypothetical protein